MNVIIELNQLKFSNDEIYHELSIENSQEV